MEGGHVPPDLYAGSGWAATAGFALGAKLPCHGIVWVNLFLLPLGFQTCCVAFTECGRNPQVNHYILVILSSIANVSFGVGQGRGGGSFSANTCSYITHFEPKSLQWGSMWAQIPVQHSLQDWTSILIVY